MLANLEHSGLCLKRVEVWMLTEWMTAASAALTRMAVVPLSRMAVVACSATDRPLTLAPSNVTVQYLQTKAPHHIMPHCQMSLHPTSLAVVGLSAPVWRRDMLYEASL